MMLVAAGDTNVGSTPFQSVDDFQQLPQRSTETIKPDDAQAVTRTGVVEQLRQTRPDLTMCCNLSIIDKLDN